jgi:hypothetical protein
MVGKAQKSHGARSGLYGGCSNGVPPIHFFQAEHRIQFRSRPMHTKFRLETLTEEITGTSAIQSRSRPMRFLGFSNHEKGAPMQEISK